jgi:Fur family ferric uptake transcriptional regulator
MPSASYSAPRVVTGIDEAMAVLRSQGLRVSATRRAALEALLAAEGPVSAEYLASGLGGRVSGCDLPSAYRNLELFERLGMVRHVHIGHGPGLYALVAGDEHAYAVCERCGELSRLSAAQLEAIRSEVRSANGFEAHFSHFPILGLCAACAGKPVG